MNSYSCAFKSSILLQGFIFISTEALYFFSFFSDESVSSFFSFGQKSLTKMKFDLKDIERISKYQQMGFIDNSFNIILKSHPDEKFLFTSFLDRNGAFDEVLRQLQQIDETCVLPEDDEHRSYHIVPRVDESPLNSDDR